MRHNGGKVWIDELGWPWPKHECFGGPHKRADATSIVTAASHVRDLPGAGVPRRTIRGAVVPRKAKTNHEHRRRLCGTCGAILDECDHQAHVRRVHPGDHSTSPDQRGRRRCEFCKATVRVDRYANHVKRAHKNATLMTLLAEANKLLKPGRTQCQFCNANVKPGNYSGHVRRAHRNVTLPSAESDNDASQKSKVTLQVAVGHSARLKDVPQSIRGATEISLDKQGRRRCEFCVAMVRSDNYSRHLRKVHDKGPPPIFMGVTDPIDLNESELR